MLDGEVKAENVLIQKLGSIKIREGTVTTNLKRAVISNFFEKELHKGHVHTADNKVKKVFSPPLHLMNYTFNSFSQI